MFSSYAGSATGTTSQRPSGLTCGAPSRFMSQMSSWVGMRFGADEAKPATQSESSANPASDAARRIFLMAQR